MRPSQIPLPYRGLHLIRDPRDIIVSGCFYHQKATETWLHDKQDQFGGLTYQEKINSYSSLDDKILFEMDYCGRHIIEQILAWNFDDPSFLEVKYENLIADEQLFLFHTIFNFLGFPGKAIPRTLRIAYDNSLFSGIIKNHPHVRSGKAKQWEEYFTPHHKRRFLEL